MKTHLLTAIAGFLGLALAIAVILREGYASIWQVLEAGGWGLFWLIPLHALPLALDVEGWRLLLKPRDPNGRASLPFLFWIATVREAINRLLPVASVGGEFVGIRLVLLRKLSGTAVTASVVAEVLLTIVSQYLFTTIGLALLVTLLHGTKATSAMFVGLVATLPVPAMLYFLLRHGALFTRLENFVLSMLGGETRLASMLGKSATLDLEIRNLFSRPLRLTGAVMWQLSGMILGSAETWLALRLLGQPINAWEAVTLESLTLAIRHFAFFIPGGIGVQEAGLVLFGNIMGLPADVCVALSLAKRMREVCIGIPALLSWQWVEGKRLHRGLRFRTTDNTLG